MILFKDNKRRQMREVDYENKIKLAEEKLQEGRMWLGPVCGSQVE